MLKTAILAILGGGSLLMATSAMAQEAPTRTWNSSSEFRSATDRSVDIQGAEAQSRARNGGHGAGQVVINNNGDSTDYVNQTYNGAVTNSTASSVNAVAWTSNSSSTTVSGSNSNATISYSTDAVVTAGVQQGADSNVATTDAGDNTINGTNANSQ